MNIINRYLLTGAGFTKNFGGYLSQEIWSLLFNNPRIQATKSLRNLLLNDTDFESVYHKIMSGDIENNKLIISEALFTAYRKMDDVIRNSSFEPNSSYPINIYLLQDFLKRFAGTRDSPGFIFTLNQDLFLERHYYNGPRPLMPGVRQSTAWFSTHFIETLETSNFVEIIKRSELEKIKIEYKRHQELIYIKLHGSCNWKSTDFPPYMVIGRDKIDQIKRNFLLSWYLTLFEQCLSKPRSRLLIIGYGFCDPHINQRIAECIIKNDLSVYILDPTPSNKLIERLKTTHVGESIVKGIKKFFPSRLENIFPANQDRTPERKAILSDFFECKV